MIHEQDIENIVREHIGDNVQFLKREVIKDSTRSTIYRYCFSASGMTSYAVIVKDYHEPTREALVYGCFQEHHLFENILLHCDAHDDHCHLVLCDISDTHQHLGTWKPPLPRATRTRIVGHLAQWYSTNWQHYAELVQRVGLPWHLQSVQQYATYLEYLERDAREFRNNLPFPMTKAQLGYYDEALDYLHRHTEFLFDHLYEHSVFTWIHGDLNVCNLYYPLDQHDPIVILDYEAFRVGLFSDDLVMLWIHDLYHGASMTNQIFCQMYQHLHPDIRRHLTPALYSQSIVHSLSDGLFFPMKLFAHHGVKDKDLVMKSLDAYAHLVLSQDVSG